jgi:hypothetical protein
LPFAIIICAARASDAYAKQPHSSPRSRFVFISADQVGIPEPAEDIEELTNELNLE